MPHRYFTTEISDGTATLLGADTIPPEQFLQVAVLVVLPQSALAHGQSPIVVGLYSGDHLVQKMSSSFAGPDRRDDDDAEGEDEGDKGETEK